MTSFFGEANGLDQLEHFAKQTLDPKTASRLVAVIRSITATIDDGHHRMVSDVKKSPGAVLAEAVNGQPVVLVDGKRKGAPGAMLIAMHDVQLLLNVFQTLANTRHATGEDLYHRFAHSGAPSEVSVRPPREEAYVSPVIADILRRPALSD